MSSRLGVSAHPVELAGELIVLGRGADCDVVIDDPGISRAHARLVRRGDDWYLEDLESRNGTFVGDVAIERQQVGFGDIIRLGPDAEVVLVAPAHVESAPSPGSERARPAAAAWLQEFSDELLPEAAPPIRLRGSMYLIGRDPKSQLVIDDESISRLHARIDRGRGELWVTDLKSSNGTRLNGDDVVRATLSDGDVVEFGTVSFTVRRRRGMAWMRIAVLAIAAVAVVVVAVKLMGMAHGG